VSARDPHVELGQQRDRPQHGVRHHDRQRQDRDVWPRPGSGEEAQDRGDDEDQGGRWRRTSPGSWPGWGSGSWGLRF
jgi:hypothetical protein